MAKYWTTLTSSHVRSTVPMATDMVGDADVDTAPPAVSLASIANGVKETQKSVLAILSLVQGIDSRLTALEDKAAERQNSVVIEQANTISQLSSRVTLLRERLATAEDAAVTANAGARKRRARDVIALDGDDEPPSSSRPRLSGTAVAAASPQAVRQLIAQNTDSPRFSTEFNDKPVRNESEDKGKTVAECLVSVSKAGYVSNANLKTVKLPPGLGDEPSARPRVRNVLELVDFVMTSEERNVLMKPDSETQLVQTAMDLEKRAMRKIAELEGRDPDQDPRGKRCRPFIIGLGTRVRRYKKMMFESGNYSAKNENSTPRDLGLKERDEVIADARREGRLHLIQEPRGNRAAAAAAQLPVEAASPNEDTFVDASGG